MNILKARVQWHLDWGNRPNLVLLVDRIPSIDELRYESVLVNSTDRLYYAQLDGYVNFFLECPSNRSGFGGIVVVITMKDGSRKHIEGPWASRSGIANRYINPHCVEVVLSSHQSEFIRGAGYSGKISLPLFKKACDMAGVKYKQCDNGEDLTYEIIGKSKMLEKERILLKAGVIQKPKPYISQEYEQFIFEY